MNEMTRRSVTVVDRVRSYAQANVPRHVARRVNGEHHMGLIGGAHVQAAAYVTHVALQHTGMLSEIEANLVRAYPLAENRLRLLVDNFTGVAAAEIARMSW